MSTYQSLMAKNGLAVILLGLLGGFLFLFNILGAISLSPLPISIDYQLPGTSNQWRAVHTGNIMNGIMAIAFAFVLGYLDLSKASQRFVSFGTISAVWGNAGFYVFGVFAPNRGLSLGDNSVGEANWAGVLAFLPAFVVAFVLIFVVIVMLRGKIIQK